MRFDKAIENSMDVVRIFCVLFCGPFVMVECILSLAFYNKIMNICVLDDAFSNILIYILIIMGFVSITVTGFCFYMSFHFFKAVRASWNDLRHPQPAP